MASKLEQWAVVESQFLRDEIYGFKVGAKLLSPSGDNITSMKLAELESRLEQFQRVLEKSEPN